MALSSTQAEVKANEYLDLAIAALTKIRVFNKDKKWEESAAFFVKAAEHFKLARQPHEAGDAYVKAGEQLEESPRADEATEMYMMAAKAYKTAGSMKDAAKMYEKVVVVYQAKNNFSHAGKLYRELAEMEEKEKRYKEALETYEKAADAYMAADVTSHANECLLRVAELAASEALYDKAREIFEKIAVAASKNNLIKANANEYLLKAAVCCLPLCMEKNDDGAHLGRTLDRYKELVMHFDKSREFAMINKVLDAYELRNPDDFTNAIYEYDKHTRVQGWLARVLLDAKNFIKNPDTLKDFDDEALM